MTTATKTRMSRTVLPVPAEARAIRRGVSVRPSGVGRTATWPLHRQVGTVERRAGLRVFVRWGGTSFSDEMTLDEVALADAIAENDVATQALRTLKALGYTIDDIRAAWSHVSP